MTYATLEKQIRELPEEYFDEVAAYIDYLMYRNASSARPSAGHANTSGLAVHFGVLPNLADGLAIQRETRNEWN